MLKSLNNKINYKKYHFPIFICVMILMTVVTMYLFSPLCPGVDFYVHYNRLVILMEALQNGSFPYYMDYHVLDGYGYIIKLFYSDFLFVPFAYIGNMTNDVFALKSLIFSMLMLCGIFTYKASYSITKSSFAATLTGILYTFCYYKIARLYLGGVMGEMMALSCLPLIIWGAYEIICANKKKWYILSIGFSLVIFAHVITTVLAALTLAIFILIYIKYIKKEQLYYFILAALTTIFITAYYVFPMIEQMLSNTFYYDTNKLVNFMVTMKVNEIVNGLFNIITEKNIIKVGALLTFTILTRVFVSKKTKTRQLMDVALIVAIVYLIMVSQFFPWDWFPFSKLKFIQFSWRLYGFISILFAFAGGYYISLIVKNDSQKIASIITLIIIQLAIFNSESIYYKLVICQSKNHYFEINTGYAGLVGAEYLPSSVPQNKTKNENYFNTFLYTRGQIVTSSDTTTQISNFYKNKGHITFDASIRNTDHLELPLTYYKGYRTTLDGSEIIYQQSNNGLIELPITQSGKVEVQYVGTTLQKISYWITIVSILVFIIFVIVDTRKNKHKNIAL